jgi:hypothetical protein
LDSPIKKENEKPFCKSVGSLPKESLKLPYQGNMKTTTF